MTTPSEGRLAEGQVFGRYRILRLLGKGGMGAVYAAEHLGDGRVVALKVLGVELESEADRQRFLREGELAARIDHPHCVFVYRTEEVEGLPTISMELVGSGTLEEKVERRGVLPAREAIDDILQVVDGLRAAHRLGILHRDVKPANCFVGAEGEVKVGDFGLSRPVDGGGDMRLTATGVVLATPTFAPPEQLLGEPIDFRADIYSVGATLYFLLTGQLPFTGATSMIVLASVLQGSPPAPRFLRPEIPSGVDRIVMRCLARDREARFTSYDELIAALELERAALQITPARPSARLVGFGVDLILASVLFDAASAAVGRASAAVTAAPFSEFVLWWVAFVIVIALPTLRWGGSPGQLLVGLRVRRLDGEPATGVHVFVRTSTLFVFSQLVELLHAALGSAATAGWLIVASRAAPLVLLATCRPANGFRLLHDWVSKTRVIMRTVPGRVATRAGVPQSTPASGLVDPATVSHRRVGQFNVVSEAFSLADGSLVQVATDTVMHRPVWLHEVIDGTPMRSVERRTVARGSRLRWIAGQRNAGESWDAYAAPSGERLQTVASPATWRECREWLLSLTIDLQALERERTEFSPGLETVWLTHDRRAIWLDFATGVKPPVPAQAAGLVLGAVARHALGAEASSSPPAAGALVKPRPLPPDYAPAVRRTLQTMETASSLSQLQELLERAPATDLHVGRSRRVRAMAISAAPALTILLLVISLVVANQLTTSPLQRTVKPMITMLASDDRRILGAPESLSGLQFTTRAYSREERGTAAIFLRSRHGTVLADTVRRRTVLGDSLPWRVVDSVLRTPPPSADEVARAVSIVEHEWNGRPPRTPSPLRTLTALLGAATLVSTMVVALFALIAALTVRRGLAMRTCAIDAVIQSGAPASRPRLAIRALATWSPAWLALAIWKGASTGQAVLSLSVNSIASGAAPWLTGTAVLAVAAVLFNVRSPRRGLGDVVAGTYSVPV